MISVQNQIISGMTEGMGYMTAILSINLIENAAKLAAVIIANSNPLKAIFTSPDAADIADRAGEVADSASEVVRGAALFKALFHLNDDTIDICNDFRKNAKQLKSMNKLVEKIKQGNLGSISTDADDFLKEYHNYTPKRDRSTLARNDALWSAYKDSMCNVLYGKVGVNGALLKSIVGAKLLCEKLEGTLAQFFALRKDIFDFQFQLVDSLAAIMRGIIAKRYAKKIEPKHDNLPASEAMTGFMASENYCQIVCTVFCDGLEYRNHGTPVDVCATDNGFYRLAKKLN